MYVPPIFRPQSEKDVLDFLKTNSFGILVSLHNNRPVATHIPMLFRVSEKEKCSYLEGHISRGNEQQLQFTENEQVLAIFQGSHSYISSSWYEDINVPTWNYSAVHIYGKVKRIEGEELYQSLKALSDTYEKGREHRFHLEDMPEKMLKKDMRGIVGFRVIVDKIEAASKMSQNRKDTDYKNIIKKLEEKGDEHSLGVANEMKKLKK